MALDIARYKKMNHEFDRRVGLLNWYEDLEALGFQTTCISGSFSHRDVPMLEEYCKDNPSYHIVSFISLIHTVNRLDYRGSSFFLANGDSDPSLELILPQEVSDHFATELKLLIDRLNPKLNL